MMTANIRDKKGFGLIDIFIGITLCALMLIGFVYSTRYYESTRYIDRNLSQLQKFSAISTTFITRSLWEKDEMMPSDLIKTEIYKPDVGIFPNHSVFIAGTHQNKNNSDTITVSYSGNANTDVFDCSGFPLKADQETISEYYININKQLVCSNKKIKDSGISSGDPLIEGVEAMHIRYGEDINNDGIIDRYVNADFPGLSSDQIASVKISLLLRTENQVSPILDTKYYTLQDMELGPFKDHYLRRVYTMNIQLKDPRKQ